MNDLQERLRDAITAAVADARPSFDVMAAVRRRHRRIKRLRAAAAAAAAVMIAAGSAVFLAARQTTRGHGPPPVRHGKVGHQAALFPGGGRLLLAEAGTLRWLYTDGRTIRIPGHFDAAQVAAGRLLAWRYSRLGGSYYLMRLDGTRQRLILPAGDNEKVTVINTALSPNASNLAYIQQDVVSAAHVTFTLWVLNLTTGHRADLGPMLGTAFSWWDNATVLIAAPGGRSLQLVNAATGSRSAYLAVTDPVLIRAYERARPGAGPPAYIGSDGLVPGGSSRRVAVWLAAASNTFPGGKFPQSMTFTRPAEVIMSGAQPLVSYAPATPQQLELTWGPHGLVLLRTGAGDVPGSWNAYAGTLDSGRLSRPIPYGMGGAFFSPAGNVIALQDASGVTLVPTPRPACDHTVRCLSFGPANLTQGGTVQAWIP